MSIAQVGENETPLPGALDRREANKARKGKIFEAPV
jgi:hypothetical protein